MAITRLTLTNFRSYTAATIMPGPEFVVLTGDNGAGKTNVLEAISLLAPGRGLRGAALGDMARRGGSGGFGVAARLDDAEIGTGTTAAAPERRIVRVNGAGASAAALGEWLSLVWLTPMQDRLFAGTPGDRRRFFDRLVLSTDPGHAYHSARYEAAMRQRNRLLAEGHDDDDWLTALERAMGEHGRAISNNRLNLILSLTPYIWRDDKACFPRSRIKLANMTMGDLAKKLTNSRATHRAAGRTLHGPQMEDFVVTYEDKGVPAASSSTGEQKALLIGIVLAHADLVAERQQRRPILLLDEVAAHLDPTRRAALFDRLAQAGGQVWLTGTERAAFAGVPPTATWLTIADGAVHKE